MKPFQLKPNRAAAVETEERQIDRETGGVFIATFIYFGVICRISPCPETGS